MSTVPVDYLSQDEEALLQRREEYKKQWEMSLNKLDDKESL